MVSEEGYEEDWQEEEWNENYDGYWTDDQNWNEGYWAYDDLYYMDEYGYFQKKGKGKGKGKKGKKGKDDDGKGGKPGDGKGKSNYVQPQTTSAPAIQNQQTQQAHYSSTASSSGHGFFAFANSQQSKCTEKLVIFMYDHGWNTQFTEFDIVEEGDVPLLMSLPQMRNLGFQFELTPDKASLSCARIGMRKMVLRTAISTHLILDLQDVAWYMSQVHFKTPQVKSFFSQHDHFEYSQIAVKQDVHEEEALVTGDYWQVDPLRRELIRHHEDKRKNLHEMNRSDETPIPKDQLLDERETHQEFQKSKKKVLHKDNWRTDRKRFSEQSEEFWKGKTIYKIKEDYVIPDDIVRSDIDRAKPFRGNIDDLFHPESASSVPSGVQKKKPRSLQKEEGKSISKEPSSKKIEVGPPAAKRHVGKQKPQVVDDSQSGSSRKKVVVSYPKLDEEDELDIRARELGLDKIDSDEPQVIEPKPSAPARNRGKQDSESQMAKLGSDALEPRRVSIPLPGSEVQAMTPAYRKMLRKLEDSVELYKLHIKHYHMSPTQFRRRTSMLGLPDSVYEKYEEMYKKCRVCSTSIAPPPRARISGIRSTNFGDVIFVDHAEIQLRKNKYMVLLVLDGATNLLWATAQNWTTRRPFRL